MLHLCLIADEETEHAPRTRLVCRVCKDHKSVAMITENANLLRELSVYLVLAALHRRELGRVACSLRIECLQTPFRVLFNAAKDRMKTCEPPFRPSELPPLTRLIRPKLIVSKILNAHDVRAIALPRDLDGMQH